MRAISCDGGVIIYSALNALTVEAAISREISVFTALNRDFEWKVYGHDAPKDLAARLCARGFSGDPTETLMVLDLTRPIGPVPEIDVRQTKDVALLRDLMSVHEAAFSEKRDRLFQNLKSRLQDSTMQLFVVYVDGKPVSAGRAEMPGDRSFASLWGGGTIPQFRGRGFFRGLVAIRAAEARRRGYRYITVDAREASREILARLGFVRLTEIAGWNSAPIVSKGVHWPID